MVQFEFTVGNAFRNSAYHPITIPKRHYGDLVRQGLDQDDVAIVGPDGQPFTGQIYRGIAGWGEYFQIRARNGHVRDELARLQLDQVLLVNISEWHGRVRVQLSRH